MAKKKDDARAARWRQVVGQYRHRHRAWTMEMLPTMSDREWKEYVKWVAGFGGMHQRKLKRALSGARGNNVSVTVTNHGEIGEALQKAMQPATAPTTRMILHLGSECAVARLYRDAPQKNNIQMLPAGATRRT